MRLPFTGRLPLYLLTVVLFFLSSCSSYYWTAIDSADLEKSDRVYKVRTVSGDTVNFRSRPGSSAFFDGEAICGTDESGSELIIGLDEVEEIEIAAWDPAAPYFVCGGLLIFFFWFAVELNTKILTPF